MASNQFKSEYKRLLQKEEVENQKYAKAKSLTIIVAIIALLLRMSDYAVTYFSGYGLELNADLALMTIILIMVTKLISGGHTWTGAVYYIYNSISLAVQLMVAAYYESGGSKEASLIHFLTHSGFWGIWMTVIMIGCVVIGIVFIATPDIKYFRTRTKEIRKDLLAMQGSHMGM